MAFSTNKGNIINAIGLNVILYEYYTMSSFSASLFFAEAILSGRNEGSLSSESDDEYDCSKGRSCLCVLREWITFIAV